MKKVATAIAGFAMSMATAGCATGLSASELYTTPPDSTAKILSGEMGGIVVDLALNQTCEGGVSLTYRSVDSDVSVSKYITSTWNDEQYIEPGTIPIVLAVPAGRYRFDGGRCVHYSGDYIYTFSLDTMALWVKPVEVENGRIVYGGTPSGEKVMHEFGIALTDMEKMSGRKIRSSDTFWLYDIRDESTNVVAEVKHFNPELAERFTSRVSAAQMDKETVRKIIADAYAEEAGEVAADDAAAARNRKAARERTASGILAHLIEQLKQDYPADRIDDLERAMRGREI